MNKKGAVGLILFVLVLVIGVVLVWGFIGGQEAQSVGVTCDMGMGDALCWSWHTNTIGQIGEAANNLFG